VIIVGTEATYTRVKEGQDFGSYRIQPDVVDISHGLVAGKLDAPLSSVLVGGVLPHGLDSLLEDMVVGTDGQIAHLHNVVVHTITLESRLIYVSFPFTSYGGHNRKKELHACEACNVMINQPQSA